MTRESPPPREVLETAKADVGLNASERQAIALYADLRRRSQELRKATLNLELPGATEAMRSVYNEQTALAQREAKGEEGVAAEVVEASKDKINELLEKAVSIGELFPELAALCYAEAAKVRQVSSARHETVEVSLDYLLTLAREASDHTQELPKTAPSSLLAGAMILGTAQRLATETPLPSHDKVARAATTDQALMADWALVLPEKDRSDFLSLFPNDAVRGKIGREIDLALAPRLHQAVVEKEGEEPTQRLKVRSRLFQELKSTVELPKADDKIIARKLAEALGTLGEDTRQLLLELVRDATEDTDRKTAEQPGHIPRVIKVFLDNFDDWRGNDVVLRLAGDVGLNSHLAIYLLGKLVEKGYLPKDIKEWWQEQKAVGKIQRKKFAEGKRVPAAVDDEGRRLEVIRGVVTDLGVMPSREILAFIHDDKNWKTKNIADRVAEIRSRQAEFDKLTDSRDLIKHLHGDPKAAMIFYLLHGGDDRFNLINNYSFEKFKAMLAQIVELKIHPKPIQQFESALQKGGIAKAESASVVECLKTGHFPLANAEPAYQSVSFEVSENAAVKNANVEIGRVLGKNELGVVLLFPLYREWLKQTESDRAGALLEKMATASTMADRGVLMAEIEKDFPDFRNRAKQELEDDWKKLGEKMLLEVTLDNVFDEERVPIRGEELLPRLDAKRLDLKKLKKDLLVALKGGNERAKRVMSEIGKKKKALANLRAGLERQTDEVGRNKLDGQITNIEAELQKLEEERALVSNMSVEDRFADLPPEERRKKIEELGKEIIAVTEKSPSAIFTYITMQVLGEERLLESDVALVQELESHLQGPFQTIQDAVTYQKPLARGAEKKRQQVGLRFVDKGKQLMHLVRFADSKICCFSSNNYEMIVQHGVPNKLWVASVIADPLSFVVSMELPNAIGNEAQKQEPRENLGFMFASFAVNEGGELGMMNNGIYYAPGIENGEQVRAILDGVKRMFKGLPIKTSAIASQHGGSIKMPEGFTNDPVTLTRLRALDDGAGQPETKIYDDLGTGSNLNQSMLYGGHVWHEDIE